MRNQLRHCRFITGRGHGLVPMAPTLAFAECETAKPPRSLPGDGACGARGWVTLHGLMKELPWDWNEQRRGFRLAAVKTTVSASATESPRFPSGRAEILLA